MTLISPRCFAIPKAKDVSPTYLAECKIKSDMDAAMSCPNPIAVLALPLPCIHQMVHSQTVEMAATGHTNIIDRSRPYHRQPIVT